MKKLTFETICNGEANEQFLKALKEVFKDILNVDKEQGAKRQITVNFVFYPNEDYPEDMNIKVQTNIKLAAFIPGAGRIYIEEDRRRKAIIAKEVGANGIKGQLTLGELGIIDPDEVESDYPKAIKIDTETGEVIEK